MPYFHVADALEVPDLLRRGFPADRTVWAYRDLIQARLARDHIQPDLARFVYQLILVVDDPSFVAADDPRLVVHRAQPLGVRWRPRLMRQLDHAPA